MTQEVGDQAAGLRADVYLAQKYPDFSRSTLLKLFKLDLVKLNDKLAKPSQKLKAGDQIWLDDQILNAEPEQINLPILFENDDVIVMDKPVGVLTHSKGGLNLEGTVASFIAPKVTELEGNRAGIVHRLDRGTSGVIIAAKNPAALKHLQRQFAQRKTKKTYLALIEGKLSPAEGVIDIPIGRNPRDPKSFRPDPAGKSAQTEYKVLDTYVKNDKEVSLIELRPKTGRTHQLRVHLAHIGYPIIGDPLYGGAEHDRMMLHAARLELTLPGSERRVFESQTPEGFAK